MHTYYQKLHALKGFLVSGEAIILFIRLIFQVLFTLPSALMVVQVLLASIIYSRRHCQSQTQIYIIINCLLFYSIAYNQIFEHYYKYSEPNSLIQNFKNDYKVWGYIGESLFRIVGMAIAWRCYQFSSMIDQQSEDDLQFQ